GNMFGDPLALQRFQREARACAKITHQNIVAVYDCGALRGEGAYLVMEFLEGLTLRQELEMNRRLDSQQLLALFDQVLEGVKQAHRHGIVHRDLKPENVLISWGEGEHRIVKVLDFGLAKIERLDPSDPNSLTMPGTVLGTLNYMSPEQLLGD